MAIKWRVVLAGGVLALPLSVAVVPSQAVADEEPPTGTDTSTCPEDLGAAPGEICLFAVTGRTSEVAPDPTDQGVEDAVTIEAVRLTTIRGDRELADDFIASVEDEFSDAVIDRMKAAVSRPRPKKPTLRLEPSSITRSAGVTTRDQVFGDPKYVTYYWDYWVSVGGEVDVISTTKAEWFQYINTDDEDYGYKALAVHYTKISGRDTYYSDGVCKIRHSSPFWDSDVATWGRCADPDHNSVNNWDMWRYEKDYYGTRGEKYYNKFWIDINPQSADYPTIRANRSGPLWKNPDAGGRPRWL